jgi:phage terminase Nu1 subunit (DNA packaging protein)
MDALGREALFILSSIPQRQQPRLFNQELDLARDEFEVAAGTFQYILDNFDNAPRYVATLCGLSVS